MMPGFQGRTGTSRTRGSKVTVGSSGSSSAGGTVVCRAGEKEEWPTKAMLTVAASVPSGQRGTCATNAPPKTGLQAASRDVVKAAEQMVVTTAAGLDVEGRSRASHRDLVPSGVVMTCWAMARGSPEAHKGGMGFRVRPGSLSRRRSRRPLSRIGYVAAHGRAAMAATGAAARAGFGGFAGKVFLRCARQARMAPDGCGSGGGAQAQAAARREGRRRLDSALIDVESFILFILFILCLT